jgi:hypothetical protein
MDPIEELINVGDIVVKRDGRPLMFSYIQDMTADKLTGCNVVIAGSLIKVTLSEHPIYGMQPHFTYQGATTNMGKDEERPANKIPALELLASVVDFIIDPPVPYVHMEEGREVVD